MKRRLFHIIIALSIFAPISAQQWPTPTRESKPGARWWWLGSAVDEENLQWNMQQYANHGIGAMVYRATMRTTSHIFRRNG